MPSGHGDVTHGAVCWQNTASLRPERQASPQRWNGRIRRKLKMCLLSVSGRMFSWRILFAANITKSQCMLVEWGSIFIKFDSQFLYTICGRKIQRSWTFLWNRNSNYFLHVYAVYGIIVEMEFTLKLDFQIVFIGYEW